MSDLTWRQVGWWLAYQRVQDFLAANPVPPPGSYGEPKAMLDDVIAQLSDHGGDQVIGAKFAKAERGL